MVKITLVVIAFSFLWAPVAEAAGYCPNRPGGKCPTKVEKKPDSRNNYTAAEREKMREQFRLACKKHYGATSTLLRVDYHKRRYVCTN